MPKLKTMPASAHAFLAAYARVGTIQRAARMTKVSRYAHSNWINRWPQYRPMFASAHVKACEFRAQEVEDELFRRGTIGEEEVVVCGDKVVFVWRDKKGRIVEDEIAAKDPKKYKRAPLTRTKKSDACLIFEAKGLNPEKYRERAAVDVTTAGQSLHRAHPTQQLMQQVLADPAAFAAAGVLADRLRAVPAADDAAPDGSPSPN